jgi:hypothetical protein
MPNRQEISLARTAPVLKSNHVFCLPTLLGALIVCGVLATGLGTPASAQETPKPPLQTQPSPSPAAQPPADQAPSAPAPSPNPVAFYNFLQSKSIVFPDIALGTERLSPGQKFELFVDNSISLHTVTYAVLGSAVGQADDSPTGFGEGGDAYAKRFGSSMARQASSEFFGTFIIASALHEDPRFYAEINPPFFHAVKYSLQQVFIIRNDDGRDVVAWSHLAGPAMAEGLANAYWPDRNRTVGDTLFRYGLDLAARAGGNMLREYWPVVYAKVHHAPPPSAGH